MLPSNPRRCKSNKGIGFHMDNRACPCQYFRKTGLFWKCPVCLSTKTDNKLTGFSRSPIVYYINCFVWVAGITCKYIVDFVLNLPFEETHKQIRPPEHISYRHHSPLIYVTLSFTSLRLSGQINSNDPVLILISSQTTAIITSRARCRCYTMCL